MRKQIFILSTLFVGCFIFLSMTESNLQDPWDVPAKYQKMENPYVDVADEEKIGRILYSKHCKSCHGTKGKGDGTKTDTIDTELGDFTDGSLNDQTDGALYYKTFIGRDDMPSFNKKIKVEEEKWMIINYLRKLANK